MLKSSGSRTLWAGFRGLFSIPILLWSVAMGFALMVLPMTVSKADPTLVESASVLLRAADPAVRAHGIRELGQMGGTETTRQLATFFQNDQYLDESSFIAAQTLAQIGTVQSYKALIGALREGQPKVRRAAAIAALKEAKPNVLPLLVTALAESDSQMRLAAAQIIGLRRAVEASDALLGAAQDADANVRAAALWSLSEIGMARHIAGN